MIVASTLPEGSPSRPTPEPAPRPSIDIGGAVTTRDIHDIATGVCDAYLGAAAAADMRASHDALQRMVADRRRIYGVSTGFGPLASQPVAPEHAEQLQQNLVYHLCSGVGAPLSVAHTRAMIAARASSLARGRSGIGAPLFQRLLDCLALDLVPVVPELGTVGASGDLTPLAHVALALLGEGEMWHHGVRVPSRDALRAAGLAPVTFGHKEGIALVNGTSCMTGIAAVNAERAQRAAELALRLAVVHAECLGGRREAWDPRLGQARPHAGQVRAHERLQQLTAGGTRLVAPVADEGSLPGHEVPQDPYTMRCVPQLVGAVLDVLRFHDDTVTTELQSATDNPLIFAEDDAVVHGGNFYGQPVAFASDALFLGVTKLAIHAERCLAQLTDGARNRGLPPFLRGGPAGLNSGFMGAQVTASALVAELRTRAVPASIQSVPTNADNQDVVSMGTIAARKAAGAIELVHLVLAIQALALAQAAELRGGAALHGFAPSSQRLIGWIRSHHPPLLDDRPLSADIESMARRLPTIDWVHWS